MSKVFNMVGGGGGPAASIFVTGLSETDTVTATNGSKTKAGVWTQIPNPDYVVPGGYTQLEYIESTGTQYINTGVSGSGPSSYKLTMAVTKLEEWQHFFANDHRNNTPKIAEFEIVNRFLIQSYPNDFYTDFNLGEIYTFEFKTNGAFFINGELFCSFSGNRSWGSLPMWLFRSSEETTHFSNMRAYALEMRTNNEAVRHYVPCKRNSDNAIGLYDLVTNSFFGNDGTGDFIAGPETPQYVGGFSISPIRDFGTWTVTATDGTNTATQDVLVDVITEYGIEMSLAA